MSIRFHSLNRNRINGVDYFKVNKCYWKLFQIGIVSESSKNWWIELVIFNREVNANIFWLGKEFRARVKAEGLILGG